MRRCGTRPAVAPHCAAVWCETCNDPPRLPVTCSRPKSSSWPGPPKVTFPISGAICGTPITCRWKSLSISFAAPETAWHSTCRGEAAGLFADTHLHILSLSINRGVIPIQRDRTTLSLANWKSPTMADAHYKRRRSSFLCGRPGDESQTVFGFNYGKTPYVNAAISKSVLFVGAFPRPAALERCRGRWSGTPRPSRSPRA